MRERCFKIDIAFAKLQTPSKFRVSIESRRTRRVILSFCFPEQRLLMWQTSPLASRRRNRYQEDTQQGLRVRHLVVTVRPTCCMGPRIIFFLFLFGRQSTRTVVSILGKGRRDNRIYKSRNFHIPVYLDREYARSCTRTWDPRGDNPTRMLSCQNTSYILWKLHSETIFRRNISQCARSDEAVW